jgi:hypothetical protein
MSVPTCAAQSEVSAATTWSGTATARGRPSWSGLLQLSLVTIPVKAYPATCTSHKVHFRSVAGTGVGLAR